MKTELSLIVEEDLLKKAEDFAKNKGTDLSAMVENYLQNIMSGQPLAENIFDLIKRLPKVDVPDDLDLKELYREEMAKKYGK